MAREMKCDNYRVEVTPADRHVIRMTKGTDHDYMMRDLKLIVDSIKRHVDDVEDVRAECDAAHVCSHCGYNWTEDSDTFNGGCCGEDVKAAPEGWEP